MSEHVNRSDEWRRWTFGLTGRLVVAWTMAGGLVLGGVYVAYLTLTDRMSSAGAFWILSLFYGAGALLGYLHGAFLGYLGRPEVARGEAVRGLILGTLVAVPAMAVAWVPALWLGLTSVGGSVGLFSVAGVAVGWLVALTVCWWAVSLGARATRNLFLHWRHARIGGSLLVGAFLLLATAFILLRPEIWWTDARVTQAGAVILALGATVWIVAPLLVVTFKLAQRFGQERTEAS